MQQQIQYRAADLSDAQAIADFNIAMAMETEGRELQEDVVVKGVRSLINCSERGFYIVADSGGEPLGCLMITFEWSDWRNGTFWWIQSVYIKPSHRRKGVFKGLFSQVRELAANHDNVCGLRLYVERDNNIAMQTYQSLGMHQTPYLVYELDGIRTING